MCPHQPDLLRLVLLPSEEMGEEVYQGILGEADGTLGWRLAMLPNAMGKVLGKLSDGEHLVFGVEGRPREMQLVNRLSAVCVRTAATETKHFRAISAAQETAQLLLVLPCS